MKKKTMESGRGPEIIAVGGGKGGVGKSFIAAGIAMSLARRDYDTVIIDLDLGGANLHTLLGIRHPETGIGDYIYRPHSRDLLDYVTETGTKGLKLISGYGFIPGIANLNYLQKLKLIRAISRLENDYIILDLGAGTSYNVIDFFSITESGIIVTNAEPTAVLNAYEFVKNVLFRMIERRFSKDKSLLKLVRNYKKPDNNTDTGPVMEHLVEKVREVEPDGAAAIEDICRKFVPALVLNMASGPVDLLSARLHAICRRFLSIDVGMLDSIPLDENVRACLLKMKHILMEHPDSPSSRAICDIAEKILDGRVCPGKQASEVVKSNSDVSATMLISGEREDMELAGLISDFFKDFPGLGIESGDVQAENAVFLQPDSCLDFGLRTDGALINPRFMPFDDMLAEKEDLESDGTYLSRIMAIADAEDALLAIANQDKLREESREVGRAWLECGYSLLAAHQQKSAFKAFMRSYNLMPDIPAVAVSAGAALLSGNKPLEAAKIFEKALKFYPDNPFLLYNQALSALRLEQFSKSLDLVEKLSANHILDAEGKIIGSESAFMLKRYDMALKFMNSMNGTGPWQADMLAWNRAVIFIKLGKYKKAVEMLDAVLRSNPADSQSFAARGVAFWKLNDVDEALADFNRAVELKNSDINYRAARGTAAFHAGLMDRAIGDIEVITRLRPDNVKFKALLQAIQANIGL